MIIIIINRFRKELEKFSKYFNLQELINDLKKKNKKFLHVHDDFFKFKSKLNSVEFRGIVFLIEKNNKVMPLFVALKKDKLY